MFSYEHSKLGYFKKKQRYINFKRVSRLLAQKHIKADVNI